MDAPNGRGETPLIKAVQMKDSASVQMLLNAGADPDRRDSFAGMSARGVVSRLRQWRIIGSDAPYGVSHARLTPSIRNTPEDVAFALKAVAALG